MNCCNGSNAAIFILAQKGSLLTHDPEASPARARNCREVKHGNSLKIIPVFCWCGLKGWGKIKSWKLAMSEYQHQTRILICRWTRYRVPDAKKIQRWRCIWIKRERSGHEETFAELKKVTCWWFGNWTVLVVPFKTWYRLLMIWLAGVWGLHHCPETLGVGQVSTWCIAACGRKQLYASLKITPFV